MANSPFESTFQTNPYTDRAAPSAILSSVLPIRTHSASNEQSTGLCTGEKENCISTIMALSNVVSFELNRKTDTLAKMSTHSHHTANCFDANDIDEDEDDERIIKGRERNREHARKTRLRKKAQLQELELKYRTMLAERQTLNQQLQDRNVASILLGLSSSAPPTITESSSVSTPSSSTVEQSNHARVEDILEHNVELATGSTDVPVMTCRKRGFPEVQLPTNISPLSININGIPTAITSKSHINWKTGMYCDEMGRQSQMTPQQLEDLRYVVLHLHRNNHVLV